ncbi:MAG: OmpA family protein [Deltaproteobacteria bacterium]|nr:OmpA family protein [Deltaproteobacteria bacterium]
MPWLVARGSWLVLIGAMCVASVARADDVDVELKNKVPVKEGLPALILHVHARVSDVQVHLEGGGKKLELSSGPLKPGQTKRFTIDPGNSAVEYTGSLTVKYPAKEGKEDVSMDLHFVAEVIRPLAVNVSPGDIDVAKGELKMTANRPLAKVEVQIIGEDGLPLGVYSVDPKGIAAGAPIPVSWKVPKGNVLKIHIQATDADGFYVGEDLFPWRVDVPHQDVSFASGSSALPPSETGKLDAALQQILPQVAKARPFADVRVFVVGHTDTVGSDEHNQKLSEDRARAIAGYFRAHGVSVPIEYAGMGEKALLVNTPDETDEPRNRRAEYVLSVGEPTVAHATTAAVWHRL